jgi:hypothetical protein
LIEIWFQLVLWSQNCHYRSWNCFFEIGTIASTPTVSLKDFDQQTIMDFDRLTQNIDKKYVGRSYKYNLILDARGRRKNEESLRKNEEQKEERLQQIAAAADAVQSLPMERQQSLQERQQSLQERQQSLQEGNGHVLIPQDVNETANRLNLLCGSLSAGNDNIQLKNEISALCDHLYKQNVLTKPQIKRLIKRYCM